MGRIVVGVCGVPRSLKTLNSTLDAVEVQETFYHPKPQKYILWRQRAADLEFTVKAWFLITHGANKMLLRKAKLDMSEIPWPATGFGGLKPSEPNLWALERVFESAQSMGSKIIVFQTPASLKLTKELLESAAHLFSVVRERGFIPAWEPRGYAPDKYRLLHGFAVENQVVLIVDPLRRETFPPVDKIVYFRLHGLGGREVNYRYRYTERDLTELLGKSKRHSEGGATVYVMFNNVYMYNDALRFKALLGKH